MSRFAGLTEVETSFKNAAEDLVAEVWDTWSNMLKGATDSSSPTETAVCVRNLTMEMLEFANDPCTRVLSCFVDKIMSRMYMPILVAADPRTKRGTTVEVVHGILRYGLSRTRKFISHREGNEGEARPRILWEGISQAMLHAVNNSRNMDLVRPASPLGRLYATSGFITMMEVMTRSAIHELDLSEDRHYVEAGGDELLLAWFLCVSLFLMSWVLRNGQPFPGTNAARESSLSFFGTILKLQRLLEKSLPTRVMGTASDPKSQRTLDLMHDGLHTLMSIPLSLAQRSRTRTKTTKTDARLELRSLQALVGQLGILETLNATPQGDHKYTSHPNTTAIFSFARRSAPMWKARIEEITSAPTSCDDFLGCHNPRCMRLERLTESVVMVHSRLCSGCRKVRYCSRECQREDFAAHGRC